jgi:hypothetical protein
MGLLELLYSLLIGFYSHIAELMPEARRAEIL